VPAAGGDALELSLRHNNRGMRLQIIDRGCDLRASGGACDEHAIGIDLRDRIVG
jgi:hypothetical protein